MASRTTALVFAAIARAAAAGPGHDQDRAINESPDPAVPAIGLDWRDGLRGVAGARVPIVRRDDRLGFAFELPAFIQLHNDGAGVVPYQMWRGHIAALGSYRWGVAPWTLRAHGALEHESDHDQQGHWVYYEAITAGFTATLETRAVRWTLSGQARLLFETCTFSIDCTYRVGRGSTSVQGTASVVADFQPTDRHRPFVAIYADATQGRGDVVDEVRAIAHAGYVLDVGQRGVWQLFGEALAGREVGYDSLLGNQLRIGAGLRWEP